jgi:hypothetical protein
VWTGGADAPDRRSRWWRRLPASISVGAAVVGIVGGLIVIFSAAINVVRWAESHLDWRAREYATLTSLKAGFDVRYFEDQLGHPVFTRRTGHGFAEYTFRGRDYWAQAIAHRGAVETYSVTSCDPDFRPTFDIPSEPRSFEVTLRSTKLGDTAVPDLSYEYDQGANVYYFFDGFYGSLPGHYKNYLWGAITTCGGPGVVEGFSPTLRRRPLLRGSVADMPRSLRAWRSTVTINTFVETSPSVSLQSPRPPYALVLGRYHHFYLGTSPVLWRSVSSEPFPELPQ